MAILLSLPLLLAGHLTQSDAAAPAAVPDRPTLEARFLERMNGVRLVGRFTEDSAPADAAPQEESYTSRKVEHLGGDRWRFTAEIAFGTRSVPVALELDVLWAGDTPVISLTDFQVPMLGKYTARVLIYGESYAGTWSGAGHGGHLFGSLEPLAPAAPAPPAEGGDAGDGGDGGAEDGQDDHGSDPGGAASAESQSWPSFRGPQASGVQDGHATPAAWDVAKKENVRWSTEIPGLAHSSPIVWGERVFVTTAERDGEAELKVGLYGDIAPVADEGVHRFRVYCLERGSGKVLWSETAHEGVPKVKRHTKGSHAASTPATDGERVVAFFGSEGLYAYDLEGKLLWSKDLGLLDSGYYVVPAAQWGFASSPVIHDGLVVVQCDVQKDSFLAALKAETGEEVWRTRRSEVPTWSTPTIDVREGRRQVIVNGYKHIGGYDLASGAELWKLVGGGDIPVPTPVVSSGLVFITNAHGQMAPIYAIDAMAEGQVGTGEDDPFMLWFQPRRGNYMQTPLVYSDLLYCCSDAGVLACFDPASGEERYRQRLGSGNTGFTASGVAADGKLYFTSEEGEVHVVKAGPEFEVLATNELGETCMATPAVAAGTLIFRTRHRLTAIGLP